MRTLFSVLLFALVLSLPINAYSATLSRVSVGDGITGYEPALANAGGSGDVVTNADGKTLIYAYNPGAGSATVTVTAQVTSANVPGFGAITKADVVLSLAAGEDGFIGPLPPGVYNNASGNLVISYGGASAADVDIVALKLPVQP